MAIRFEQPVCGDLNSASRREWLETNGLGGYASSTICGMNTRRYHGLLVAAVKPPVGRMVLLSKLEETLVVDGKRYELSVNQYPGVVHPAGYAYLKQFRLDPFPVFVYEADGIRVEKSVFMAQSENTTVIRYEIVGAASLELRPLIAFRDFHALTQENSALDPSLKLDTGIVRLEPYRGVPAMFLGHNFDEVSSAGEWYRNFEYERERERGLDFREDLFQPLTLAASRRTQLTVIASTERREAGSAGGLLAAELDRRKNRTMIENAADQFIVQRGSRTTVIAGYPWFGDWGRDTMISLPGLTLATGRADAARGILLEFAGLVNQGMLPNRFPDAGEAPEYNTADATLWFFECARAYLERTSDDEFVRTQLYGVLEDIVAWHLGGTRYSIRVDGDGLLRAGEPGVQLTWMDAKIGDWVVTPRTGKPVEIQALWYNALRVMEDMARRFGGGGPAYGELADRARLSFNEQFWNPAANCLYDAIDGGQKDASIRPNQIFAVSLLYTMLPADRAAAVVETVERHLLTPYGLRTLSPSDSRYRGRYEGDPRSRDSAYHQGTVWPWLLGPFVTAYLAVHGGSPEARRQAALWLGPLVRFMGDDGAGQLPEVFDGDTPQRPGGCIAQAWSVAEILRTSLLVQQL